MKIGIPKEIHKDERRVAATPESAKRLIELGFSVAIESGAGSSADFPDEAYRSASVDVVANPANLWAQSDFVLKVREPENHPQLNLHEVDLMPDGSALMCFLWPAQNQQLLQRLTAKRATVFAMDCVPRISRAQKLDALSSMSNLAGYRAVIEAAHHFGRILGGQITAAGKISPAKVFVIGAGVAGLAAIGAARGLGAAVYATDTRAEVRDQIKSLGAEFVEVPYREEGSGTGGYAKVMSEGYQKAQREMIAKQALDSDLIITTALIPGKPAPKLIAASVVEMMRPGSVIVDLAAEQGGNCERTSPGEVVVRNSVTLIGYTDLASRLPRQASTLYATNLANLIEELCPNKDGVLHINLEDEVIRAVTVTQNGTILWPPPPVAVSKQPVAPQPLKPAVAGAATAGATSKHVEPKKSATAQSGSLFKAVLPMLVAGGFLLLTGQYAPPDLMQHLVVFALACVVGYMVIWNVSSSLHTPLMSVTNAISSIIAIGALIQISAPDSLIFILAGIGILLTSINMFGGFYVTQRMLRMFKR
ncbi:Re/Si-specific NAD(P)(+) transhydrogenase subunit alpha [Candidatus Acetothermia bacterium]|nr:Re/Si-specific NAD(P)(+) transhydrogenase subunit alpha [Candidatus Acetothermia bacterium]MBI3644061.1 Re/Si-specific NAD(P)(+) transhydrogenase subunit alpha [Candidatus Acetothermia bacterium]